MDRINFVIGKNSGLMLKKEKEKERIEAINSVVYN